MANRPQRHVRQCLRAARFLGQIEAAQRRWGENVGPADVMMDRAFVAAAVTFRNNESSLTNAEKLEKVQTSMAEALGVDIPTHFGFELRDPTGLVSAPAYISISIDRYDRI